MTRMVQTNGTSPTSNFTCKDEPVENQRRLKVRVIGAGVSGVYLGVRIPQRLRNVDFKIYEKNDGIGGTWWENRYPGCACDIPSHSYQYSFEPNKTWSRFYAPSKEICDYVQHVADKYHVTRFVELQHHVTRAAWSDHNKKWLLSITNIATGESFQDDADVLIAARGNLNDIAWPDIPGLDTFQGKKMHSAAWDSGYDFTGKKIGVIGGGSSSIQIVPELQKVQDARLHVFVRSKVWISNRFGDETMVKLGLEPSDTTFAQERIEKFVDDEAAYLSFRKIVEDDGNLVHESSIRGSAMQQGFVETFSKLSKLRTASKPEISPYFQPSFGVGCRRLTPGPGYLEALTSPNVEFVPQAVVALKENSAELADGRNIDLDVVVCATGFHTNSVPPFPVVGKKSQTLEQKFSPFPQTYLSITVDNFPNFFMMIGPNSALGAGSLVPLIEAQGDYIVKCIRKLQKEDYATMMPKRARVDDFSAYVGEYFKKTVYMDDCKSWYKTVTKDGPRISALWPGSLLHAMEVLRAPRWEDFEFESLHDNALRWLGNGFSHCIMKDVDGDPSWYLNPQSVDVPPVIPETDAKYTIRSYSH